MGVLLVSLWGLAVYDYTHSRDAANAAYAAVYKQNGWPYAHTCDYARDQSMYATCTFAEGSHHVVVECPSWMLNAADHPCVVAGSR
jgi:hypothetical protein